MRIVTQTTLGGPEVLETVERPDPRPGSDEVVIRTAAIGVNPVDAAVRAGHIALLGDPPFTVGWDVAGVVSAIGDRVRHLAVGDRVFGMPRFPAQAAAYAELVVAPAEEVALAPDELDDQQAAAVPLVGLTAHQALVEAGRLAAGDRVLIPAAGGGVGHVAVQLAKARGAYVVGTASPGKVEFVRSLGADHVVDYTTEDVRAVAPVDLAIDPLGGAQTLRLLEVVRPGGTFVLLVGIIPDAVRAAAAARDVRIIRTSVVPNAEALTALAELARRRQLVPHVSATFPLDKAGEAHRHLEVGVQGKVVLLP
jgi:NADPH:quinone reductase-like Zn-dependent oxidoreductase